VTHATDTQDQLRFDLPYPTGWEMLGHHGHRSALDDAPEPVFRHRAPVVQTDHALPHGMTEVDWLRDTNRQLLAIIAAKDQLLTGLEVKLATMTQGRDYWRGEYRQFEREAMAWALKRKDMA
jgi:hypothetical protein